jgi:hypothetical protein
VCVVRASEHSDLPVMAYGSNYNWSVMSSLYPYGRAIVEVSDSGIDLHTWMVVSMGIILSCIP